MSLVACASLLRPHVLRAPRQLQTRSVHIENVVGDNMPFSYANKSTFGLKVAFFMLSGFSIPIAATVYQLKKAGGGAPA